MLKKRIIFTLLFDNGQFMLSRNFRLQKVGDLTWLQRNYNFANVAFYIDELIVLDVSRGTRSPDAFCQALQVISAGCFAPIAAGGGIANVHYARSLLRSGADKVVVNSALWDDQELVRDIAEDFGQQCVVGSVDLREDESGRYSIVTRNGSNELQGSPADLMGWHAEGYVGEIYLNSVNRDGTGQGYDFKTLELLPEECTVPVILAGGVGNAKHLAEGIAHPLVDAVATANLYNFVGNGLQKARHTLLNDGAALAYWPDCGTMDFGNQQRPDV